MGDLSGLEFQPELLQEERRFFRDEDISVIAPGAGVQVAVVEGTAGQLRESLLRTNTTREQAFRASASNYLLEAYPNRDLSWRQSMIERAVRIPNYYNLFMGMLFASLYFRESAGVGQFSQITAPLLKEYGRVVLAPLSTAENRMIRNTQRRLTSSELFVFLQVELIRYLRYVYAHAD